MGVYRLIDRLLSGLLTVKLTHDSILELDPTAELVEVGHLMAPDKKDNLLIILLYVQLTMWGRRIGVCGLMAWLSDI